MYENAKYTLNEIRKSLQKITRLADDTALMADRAVSQTELNELSLELERHTEKLALLGRALPLDVGSQIIREQAEQIPVDAMDIQIGYTPEGWFRLEIPALLPKKSKSGNVNYIRAPLLRALSTFFRANPRGNFCKSVIAYRHIYDRAMPERRWRDHDNIEVNFVSDAVALFTLPDDSPQWCSHFYCSAAGDVNRTEVYVVPQTDFESWLRRYGPRDADRGQSDDNDSTHKRRCDDE